MIDVFFVYTLNHTMILEFRNYPTLPYPHHPPLNDICLQPSLKSQRNSSILSQLLQTPK